MYKMPFLGRTQWPPIGGWLLLRVGAHSRFYSLSTVLPIILLYSHFIKPYSDIICRC